MNNSQTPTDSLPCPLCKQPTLHRSRRIGLKDWFMSRLGRYPYRCDVCGARPYFRLSSTQ